MPYIPQDRREVVDATKKPQSKGELNYLITKLMIEYVNSFGRSYTNISEAIGAANDAAAEMRRRLLDPYEDEKIAEHGDVYD